MIYAQWILLIDTAATVALAWYLDGKPLSYKYSFKWRIFGIVCYLATLYYAGGLSLVLK